MTASDEKQVKCARTGLPFVTVKFAQTLDGRIATSTGDSQWISGSASLRLAHQLRREHHAIMVGIGTVLKDDPRLTVRLVDGRDPLRVILDSNLRLPVEARVLANGAARHTLVITTGRADADRAAEIERLGAEVLKLQSAPDRAGVDVRKALENLGGRGIASVLVEGGSATVTSLLAARLVDRLVIAIAPKIIGRGTEAIGELGIEHLKDALTFSSFRTRRLGPDIVVDALLDWERKTGD
jgi:diaminohydroxyphosphoribosylaminopyrimidine deaminase / 5-amino-6-(5-phosphoribosylamino)uracil reductase